MKYSYIKNYNKWLNANFDLTGLKDWNEAVKILEHLENNEERFNEPELINKDLTKENKFIPVKSSGFTSIQDIKNDIKKATELNPANNKTAGKAPFRFLTTSINLDPSNPANREIINDWIKTTYENFKDKFNVVGIQLHMNETAPHITLICKNYKIENDKVIYGNFVNGEKIKISGEEGRTIFKQKWRSYEKRIEELAGKYDLKYKQQPTGEKSKNRIVSAFRRTVEKMNNSVDDLNKKDLYNIKAFLKCDDKEMMKLKKKLGITDEIISNYETFLNKKTGVLINKELNLKDRIEKDRLNQLVKICERNGWPVNEWIKEYDDNLYHSKTKANFLIDKLSEEIDVVLDENEELKAQNQKKTIIQEKEVYLEKPAEIKTVYRDNPETLNKLNELQQNHNLYVLKVNKLKELLGAKNISLDNLIKTIEEEEKQKQAQIKQENSKNRGFNR